MVDHIYGRRNVMDGFKKRPHLFINELRLYIQYLRDCFNQLSGMIKDKELVYWTEFKENLLKGIEYYKSIAGCLIEEVNGRRQEFLADLASAEEELRKIFIPSPALV